MNNKTPSRLSDLRPGIDYVNSRLYLPAWVPPKHQECFEFLKACERLKVPQDQWPTFDGEIVLPGGPQQVPGNQLVIPSTPGFAAEPLVFTLPAFDLCDDDHRGWKRRARKEWRKFQADQVLPYLKSCTEIRRRVVSMGLLLPRRQQRFAGKKRDNAIPHELRYELAVKRHCLEYSWSALSEPYKGCYQPEQIRKAVTKLLRCLGLSAGHTSV